MSILPHCQLFLLPKVTAVLHIICKTKRLTRRCLLGPCQAVDLMELPPSTPEQLRIICNGRSGVLILRTQRVHAAGNEMSASRFETVCGKGDAKKWKSSIHLEQQPGVPGQVLQLPLSLRWSAQKVF